MAIRDVKINVDGMKCDGCVQSVTAALRAARGVKDVNVSLERKEAILSYEDDMVTASELAEAINKKGFKAQVTA